VSTTTAKKAAQRAFSIQQAAALKGVSQDTIRRAVRATEPPFLRAKKIGGRIRIGEHDLEDWWTQLPDA
jgi:excisionase family DNA binding protein